jgi:hypothetical protein
MREPPSEGTIAALIFGDFLGCAVASLFLLLGLLWWPGYIPGMGAVVWVIVRVALRRTEYWCRNCQRSWSYDDLSRSRRPSAL